MNMHLRAPGILISLSILAFLDAAGAQNPEVGGFPVLLRVSVTDPLNRYVTGLKKENFKVEEDRTPQTIQVFQDSSAPVCVAYVLDSTPTLRRQIEAVRSSLKKLLEIGHPEDEFLLVTFEQRTAQIETYSRKGITAAKSASFGNLPTISAFQDAAYTAIEELKKRTVLKRSVAIATDGGAAMANVGLEVAAPPGKEPEFQLFAISRTASARSAPMPSIERSAGSSYLLTDFEELDYYIGLICDEVRNQYILGYVSTNTRMDRKQRRVSVGLELPPDAPKLQVKAKKSYQTANP